MPVYKSSQDWLEQSRLLLEAHPETTTITTHYSLRPAPPPKPAGGGGDKDEEQLPDAPPPPPPAAAAAAGTGSRPPRARLVVKTYDPVSGVALRYRTSKAAEVGRLVQMLGGLGRAMTGTPPVPEQAARGDGEVAGGAEDEVATPGGAGGSAAGTLPSGAAGGAGAGGAKGKKKKKGKR